MNRKQAVSVGVFLIVVCGWFVQLQFPSWLGALQREGVFPPSWSIRDLARLGVASNLALAILFSIAVVLVVRRAKYSLATSVVLIYFAILSNTCCFLVSFVPYAV